MAAGRESSADVRGDEKGSELREWAESSLVAAAAWDGDADVEYGGGRAGASSSHAMETPSGDVPPAALPRPAPGRDSDVMARPGADDGLIALRSAAAAGDRIRATASDAAMAVTPEPLAPAPLVLLLATRPPLPMASLQERSAFFWLVGSVRRCRRFLGAG
mmetsp:Transcript_31766/g.75816  ORF Transcript_31766/g.75816 Transcript_31766/m.75816 type:complete len:161 (-) Transcript_31766:2-484(-)